MPNYNKVVLVGNLTKDPELRYTPGGAPVCDFSVAVNEKYTSKDGQKVEKVHFFDVTAWQRTAELVAQYCKKGNCVLVDGKLTQERWQDQSGNNRSKVKVVAERIQFLSKPNEQAAPQEVGAAPEPNADPDVPF